MAAKPGTASASAGPEAGPDLLQCNPTRELDGRLPRVPTEGNGTAWRFFKARFHPTGWVGFVLSIGLSAGLGKLVASETDSSAYWTIGAVATIVSLLVLLGVVVAALGDAVAAIGPPSAKVIHAAASLSELPNAKLVLTLDKAAGWQHGDEVDVLLAQEKHDRWFGAGEIMMVRGRKPRVVLDQLNEQLQTDVDEVVKGQRLRDLAVEPRGPFRQTRPRQAAIEATVFTKPPRLRNYFADAISPVSSSAQETATEGGVE